MPIEPFPSDPSARQRLRHQNYGRRMYSAHHEALKIQHSTKCTGQTDARAELHADVEGGCTNDGTTCLCQCHDDWERT